MNSSIASACPRSARAPVYLPEIYDRRNRSFFFHNLERTTERNFISTSLGTLPVKDFHQGNLSRLFDPAFTGLRQSGSAVGSIYCEG